MKFVLIPPGEFDMGSTEAEVAKLLEQAKVSNQPSSYIERLTSEAPKHRVWITKPFYLGASEVTQAQYERVMDKNPSKFKDDPACPVELVSWDEASAFCRKLGELPQEQTSRAEYRLPTEAEWEYACRAGTITAWYSGDDRGALREHAWFNPDAEKKTHPVGQKSPNAWGLYDMHGNVYEWCQDWWAVDYYGVSRLADPTGPAAGSYRVHRGGCWNQGAGECRAADRGTFVPSRRDYYLGFRLARTVSLPANGAASPQKKVTASPQPPPTPKPSTPPAPKPAPPWTLPPGAPPPAIAPFDAVKAKEHQVAWAKYLGVEVESENSIGIRFALIPPGEFDMGSTEAEVAKLLEEAKATNQLSWYIERVPSEAPKHRVRITKPFYLAASEVTQAQYERVVGNNPSRFKEDANCPVEQVSWDDASAFCRKLGELPEERSGQRTYRLPTEAEWEHACRCGTITPWYSGDDEGGVKEIAWYKSNAGEKTHPVCQKTANAWGLYDMHGNVWEWCDDWWSMDYYAASPLDDPAGPGAGSTRVLRGGCWYDGAGGCRSAYRNSMPPGYSLHSVGFRVAFSSVDASSK